MHKKTVIDFKELGVRQIFTDAIKELKTKDIKEVKHLLAEVEAYQNKGYYAVGYVSYEAAPAFETKFQVIDGPLMSEYLLYFLFMKLFKQSLFHLLMSQLPYQNLGKS